MTAGLAKPLREDPILTAAEAGQRLGGMSERAVKRLPIETVKITPGGKLWRCRESALDRYLEQLNTASAPVPAARLRAVKDSR